MRWGFQFSQGKRALDRDRQRGATGRRHSTRRGLGWETERGTGDRMRICFASWRRLSNGAVSRYFASGDQEGGRYLLEVSCTSRRTVVEIDENREF